MSLPKEYRKLVIETLTPDFRKAVKIVSVPLQQPGKGEVLLKVRYVGINATDVNISAGRYFVSGKVPFDVGLEGLGEIVAIGEGVTKVKVGDAVAFFDIGAYSEYKTISEEKLVPLPSMKPEFVALLVSGLTASIGLDKQGYIKKGDTVLITAAAGGLGHIAVQWAKATGCNVIGLCSTPEKAEYIKSIGADRVINYKKENIGEVLKKEYPKGIDVVWETVGGEVYKTLLENLGIRGRLVIIGYITGYKDKGQPEVNIPDLPQQLLTKSASIGGFLLSHYHEYFKEYLQKLITQTVQGQLKINLDTGKDTAKGPFKGLEGVVDGVDHLHSGKSSGKVVVQIA